MKLLLHTCCAPCAIYPIDQAKKDKFEVTGFFSNSNIHPQGEYIKRKNAARELFKREGLELFFVTYDASDFFRMVAGDAQPPERCSICWKMRLEETVSFAEKNGFDAFTTTLLGSPYQDHEILRRICESLSAKSSVRFYYKDFRDGFRIGHKEAKEKSLYCQRYCGCIFSMVEREVRTSPR